MGAIASGENQSRAVACVAGPTEVAARDVNGTGSASNRFARLKRGFHKPSIDLSSRYVAGAPWPTCAASKRGMPLPGAVWVCRNAVGVRGGTAREIHTQDGWGRTE